LENLSLISRQLQRETQAHEEARQRLVSSTREAADRSYASNTIYGRHSIKGLLEPVAKRIEERMFTLRRGSAAVDAVEVFAHLKEADSQSLALITMKTVLDVLGKEPEPSLQELTTKIGKNVQLELRMTYYAQQEPELYKKTEFFFHRSTGMGQKATVFTRAFNRQEIEWPIWNNTINHKVGTWLLTNLIEVTGWLEHILVRRGRKTKKVMTYTREFLSYRDTIMAAAESFSFCQWPMLCPPVDWTNDSSGGYLTESIRQSNPLIRRSSSLGPLKQGDLPLAMLNSLQHQAYKINPLIFAVAEHCYESFTSVGKFRRDAPMPIPENRLEKDSDKESVDTYKRARTNAENFNAQLAQKNWRTTEVMFVARKYVNEKAMWLSASFDYRGRVYFQSTFNPQGSDFDKSLFYFADEGPINRYWMAIDLATKYGLDKETMANRVKWTEDNQSLISEIASDPIHDKRWHDAAEPWCFLSAALEWKACFIDGTKTTSGLPIGIDATCSGLQHLSALTLCGDTAAGTNVTPTERPADIYRTVAEASKAHMPEKFHSWITRKETKRSVMCTPYGVTESSARNYIRLALKDAKREFESTDLTTITRAIFREAIPEVLPGPIKVMKWLKQSATEILNSGKEQITWTTPSGFVVQQDLKISNQVEVKTRLMGGTRIKCMVGDGYLGPDKAHHRSALAPNFVHGNDAALIHLTFAFWDKPYSVIHDCVLGRPCDMDQMASDIRLHFGEMYKAPVLQQWADEVGVAMDPDLMKNTLDIDSVNQSTYFFC
tara:strand:- start:24267 stop:26591 length:2325 start_codon:yes stop_codon:yes gene_type:complete